MNVKLFLCITAVLAVSAAAAWYFAEQIAPAKTSLESSFPAQASKLRELKEKWREVIDKEGGEKAYAAFLESVPHTPIEPHSQAHAFGEALYEAEGIQGLKACDSSFEFGCYHSFFGVAVHAEGIGTLSKFDEACTTKYGDMNLPCQHGIGHGVLVYTDYDNLEEALLLCETISTLPTGGCSSGVFMEYNFHTMDESADGGYVRKLEKNPYTPCDALPERFQPSCYFEQVQWWQNVLMGDFKKIGELCGALENSVNYTACYNGAGNYIAAVGEFDAAKIVPLCALMPSAEAVGLCHEGASWLVRSEPGGEETARKLCEILDEPYTSQCFLKLQ